MRALLRRAVKTVASTADVVDPPPSGLAVLTYHRVGAGTTMSVDLPAALFARQIAHLADQHAPVTLDLAADHLEREQPPRGRPPVAVTFDDGTTDFVEHALPILVEHRVPALLYVSTYFVERGARFHDGGVPASWAALRDAVSTGLVTVGSHTHTHLLLDRVDAATAADELDRSIDLIGERLGLHARHFAYPKGVLGSAATEPEVRARFRTASGTDGRGNPWRGTDLHRITRAPVQVEDGLWWFTRKAAGGLRLEAWVRGHVDTHRYAGAVR